MAKKKWYVVWKGRQPGIYDSWDACKEQIDQFKGARYKSFKTKEQAAYALRNGEDQNGKAKQAKKVATPYYKHLASLSQTTTQTTLIKHAPVLESVSVDASHSGEKKLLEYRGVSTDSGEELFRQGPFEDSTNNVGECLAIVHGLAYLERAGLDQLIYSDSRIAINWVKRRKCNTNLQPSPNNASVFELIETAELWLREHGATDKVRKWDTKNWGEIPADFGRK